MSDMTIGQARPLEPPRLSRRIDQESRASHTWLLVGWSAFVGSIALPLLVIATLVLLGPAIAILAYVLWLIVVTCVLGSGLLNAVALFCFFLSWRIAPNPKSGRTAFNSLCVALVPDVMLAAILFTTYLGSIA